MATMQTLLSLDESTLEQFLHHVIDDICGRRPAFLSLYRSKLSAFDLPVAIKAAGDLIRKSIRTERTRDELRDFCQSETDSSLLSAALTAVVVARQDELKSRMIENATKLTSSWLSDFDWSIQMVVASDKLSSIRQPLCLITLYVHHNNRPNEQDEQVVIECDRERLTQLIENLEKIDTVLQRIRT
eukprot:GILJ01009256.1.p1 GENE.GILJ01009256.1~~GILJ01009256.1.p1  ORF type:complete len:186 (-),score=18.43 GILJ01009256.1:237-794(-)